MHTTEVGVTVTVTVTVTVEEGVAAGTAEGERCRTGLLGSDGARSDQIGPGGCGVRCAVRPKVMEVMEK